MIIYLLTKLLFSVFENSSFATFFILTKNVHIFVANFL